MTAERIDAVDWAAIPAPAAATSLPGPAAALRALAAARTQVQVAHAVSALEYSRLMNGHLAAVFPAAVAATPVLLDIAERPGVLPLARDSALGLVEEFLIRAPLAGFNRVAGTPLCCAVADVVRERGPFLRGLGRPARDLLRETDAHWRFDVAECDPDGDRSPALGRLAGRLPAGPVRAEAGPAGGVCTVEVAYPPAGDSGDAVLHLTGLSRVPAGTVLRPAACGEHVH